MGNFELPEEVSHVIKSAKIAYGLAKWFADDFRLYVKSSMPKWEREIRYFWPMIVEAKTPLDVSNMSQDEYAAFRKKLPFVNNANYHILEDENASNISYKPERFRIYKLRENKEN
jgi:hypothetical protein